MGHSIVQAVSAITTGTAAKTIQVITAAANHALAINRVEIGFDGVVTTGAQVLVEFLKGTMSGGSGSSAANPVEGYSSDPEAVQATGVSGYTSEPTHTANVVFAQYVHPQGKWVWVPPDEFIGKVAGGTSFSIRVTVGTAVNYAGTISASE